MRITIFAASLLASLLATGCAAATVRPASPAAPTLKPDAPIGSNDGTPGAPPPAVGTAIFGDAVVDSVEFLMLESFPVQIVAVVRGNLPDGCTQIGEVTQSRVENAFTVHIATIRLANQFCTDALRPYEQNVPLVVYGLSKGVYTVDINGYQATIELESDNILDIPFPGQEGTATPTAASMR